MSTEVQEDVNNRQTHLREAWKVNSSNPFSRKRLPANWRANRIEFSRRLGYE